MARPFPFEASDGPYAAVGSGKRRALTNRAGSPCGQGATIARRLVLDTIRKRAAFYQQDMARQNELWPRYNPRLLGGRLEQHLLGNAVSSCPVVPITVAQRTARKDGHGEELAGVSLRDGPA